MATAASVTERELLQHLRGVIGRVQDPAEPVEGRDIPPSESAGEGTPCF